MAYYGIIPFKLGAANEVSWPNQPAFLAYNNATQTDVTGDNTAYTVAFNTEIFDQGSDFASNTFTAPITGKYALGMSITPIQLGAAHTGGNCLIVTSNRTYAIIGLNFGAVRDSGNGAIFNGGCIVDMDAGDTATVVFTVSGSTKTVDLFGEATNVWTGFWGIMVA